MVSRGTWPTIPLVDLDIDVAIRNITANVTLEQNLHGMTPTYLSMATGDG